MFTEFCQTLSVKFGPTKKGWWEVGQTNSGAKAKIYGEKQEKTLIISESDYHWAFTTPIFLTPIGKYPASPGAQ